MRWLYDIVCIFRSAPVFTNQPWIAVFAQIDFKHVSDVPDASAHAQICRFGSKQKGNQKKRNTRPALQTLGQWTQVCMALSPLGYRPVSRVRGMFCRRNAWQKRLAAVDVQGPQGLRAAASCWWFATVGFYNRKEAMAIYDQWIGPQPMKGTLTNKGSPKPCNEKWVMTKHVGERNTTPGCQLHSDLWASLVDIWAMCVCEHIFTLHVQYCLIYDMACMYWAFMYRDNT